MSNLILIVFCFTIGWVLKTSKRVSPDLAPGLGALVIHLPLPALVLLHIHELVVGKDLLLLVIAPWIIFLIGIFFIQFVGQTLKWSAATIACLQLTAGLGNTSFLGFPIIESVYGAGALRYGVIVDQLGSFLALSTVGTYIAFREDSKAHGARYVLSKIALFPPFQALILAILLRPVAFAPWVTDCLSRLGATLVPLALVAVGLQFNIESVGNNIKKLFVGLGYKLILAPLIIYLLARWQYHTLTLPQQIAVFECAMPPMITGGIIAMERKLEPELAGAMVSFGIIVSIVTLSGWIFLLS